MKARDRIAAASRMFGPRLSTLADRAAAAYVELDELGLQLAAYLVKWQRVRDRVQNRATLAKIWSTWEQMHGIAFPADDVPF